MQKNSNALKRYYREIRSWLPVSSRQKDKIVGDLSSSIDAYLDTHPEADLQEIQAHFGTPSSIAATYVDNTDTATLLQALRIRRRILTIVISSVLAVLIAVSATLTLEFLDHHDSTCGGVTSSITDGNPTEIIP